MHPPSSKSSSFSKLHSLVQSRTSKVHADSYSEILLALGENWYQVFGTSETTMDIAMILIHIVGLLTLGFWFNNANKSTIRTAGLLYSIYILFFVPLSTLCASSIKKVIESIINDKIEIQILIIKFSLFLLSSFCLVFFHFFVFCSFRPLKEGNIHWRLSNVPDCLKILLGMVRGLILTWGKIGVMPLLFSLFAELRIMQIERVYSQDYLSQKDTPICSIPMYLVIAFNSIALLSYIIPDHELCLKILYAMIACILINAFVTFFYLSKKEEILPSCIEQNCSKFYSFYFDTQRRINREG